MQAMNSRHWAVLLLTATLPGAAFAQINVAVQALHPLTIAAARATIAAPLVWGFLRLSGRHLPPPGRAWVPLLIVGLLGAAIPLAAIAWGQARITSGLGGILFRTIPVISVVLAPLLTGDERFTTLRLGGGVAGTRADFRRRRERQLESTPTEQDAGANRHRIGNPDLNRRLIYEHDRKKR